MSGDSKEYLLVEEQNHEFVPCLIQLRTTDSKIQSTC